MLLETSAFSYANPGLTRKPCPPTNRYAGIKRKSATTKVSTVARRLEPADNYLIILHVVAGSTVANVAIASSIAAMLLVVALVTYVGMQ